MKNLLATFGLSFLMRKKKDKKWDKKKNLREMKEK